MREQQRRQILAIHILHGDERHALGLADVVDAADIGMRDLAGDADFAVKALQQVLVLRGFLGQELQRHGLAQREVGGAIDFAHAAAAQQSDDAVASAQQRAGEEAAFVDVGRRRDVRDRVAGGLGYSLCDGRVGATVH